MKQFDLLIAGGSGGGGGAKGIKRFSNRSIGGRKAASTRLKNAIQARYPAKPTLGQRVRGAVNKVKSFFGR